MADAEQFEGLRRRSLDIALVHAPPEPDDPDLAAASFFRFASGDRRESFVPLTAISEGVMLRNRFRFLGVELVRLAKKSVNSIRSYTKR